MAKLRTLYGAHTFETVLYEAPLVDRYRDKVMTLRRRFGLDMALETFCAELGIVCEEAPFGQVKRELAGFAKAQKADMVAAALKIGVTLPKTAADGREDAADAVGLWLIGIRLYAKRYSAGWDKRLWSAKGALV